MTISYRVIVGKRLLADEIKAVEVIIQAVFSEIDDLFNNWNPKSEISRLNRLKEHVKVPISSKMYDFLGQVEGIVTLTKGLFDPTIHPLYELWKSKLQGGSIPTSTEIKALSPAVGWDKIHFQDQIFFKDHDKTSLDLGGIAKGHCVDLIVERLINAKFSDLYVEWGGEIRTSGQHPDHRPWRVFISRLGDRNRQRGIGEVDLVNVALATSGDYLQNWSVNIDGKRVSYSHIIDPRTYYPLRMAHGSIASASIMAPSCAMADGIATAVMLLDNVGEAEIWIKQLQKQYPVYECWLHSR
ncbi:MAG: FAD:protein FMN transferase [Parachlamydiaceae bacterium]|nr:FAD:protein FMN transferase [Parachlamydiaceae bacterium]